MKIPPTLFAKNDILLFSFSFVSPLYPLQCVFVHRVQTNKFEKWNFSRHDSENKRKGKKKIRFEQIQEKLSSRRQVISKRRVSNEFPGVCGHHVFAQAEGKRMKSGINVLPAIYPDRRATQPIYSPVSTTLCCIIEAFSFR